MAYRTMNEIVARASGEARDRLDALDADQLAGLYAVAVSDIENHTGQSFAGAAVGDRIIDGSGGREIVLPEHLARLDSLNVAGLSMTASDVALTAKGDAIVLRGELTGNYYERALWDAMGGKPRYFPGEPQSITVTGLWGWEQTPDDVQEALQAEVEDVALSNGNELAATIRAYQAMGVTSVRQGPLAFTFGGSSTISPRAAGRLDEYVWTASLGELA